MVATKSYRKWLIVCFVSVLLVYGFHRFISRQIEFVTYLNEFFRIQDYAYYIIMTKAFWFEGSGNIYELSFQQQALSAHIGSRIYLAMPLGIVPIGLVVWFPFAYAACFSMALSYTLWVAFSVGVLFAALWNVGRYVFQRNKRPLLPITLSLVTVFSATTFVSIYLGQTSVLAVGLLIHLIYFMHKATEESQSYNGLLIPLLILGLGIKPTYLALGLGLLMIYGKWRLVLYSVALVIVVITGLTPMLSVDWVPSYFHQLGIFSLKEIPDVYAWAFVPDTMNIFSSAFQRIIGNDLASLVSHAVTCSVYTGVVGFSILAKIRGKSTDRLSFLRVTKEQLFILVVGSYLLFAPYAGGYEDVLLLPVFVTVLLVGNTPHLTNYKSLALVFVLFVILLHNFFPSDKPLWLFWILKAVLIACMLNFCRFLQE
jgi:hypothetical protein